MTKKIKGKKEKKKRKEPTQRQSQKQIININIPTQKKTTRRKQALAKPIQQPSRVFMVNAPPQPFPIQPVQQPFIEPIKQPSLKNEIEPIKKLEEDSEIIAQMTSPMTPQMNEPKQRKPRSDKGKSRSGGLKEV